jgi:hypothetical protein
MGLACYAKGTSDALIAKFAQKQDVLGVSHSRDISSKKILLLSLLPKLSRE